MTRNRGLKTKFEKDYFKSKTKTKSKNNIRFPRNNSSLPESINQVLENHNSRLQTTPNLNDNQASDFGLPPRFERGLINSVEVSITDSNTGESLGYDYYNSSYENHRNEMMGFYNAFTSSNSESNSRHVGFASTGVSQTRNVGFGTSLPIGIQSSFINVPLHLYNANGPNILNEPRYLPPLPSINMQDPISNNSANGPYNSIQNGPVQFSTYYGNYFVDNETNAIIDRLASELYNYSTELKDNDYKEMLDTLKEIKDGNLLIINVKSEILDEIRNFINKYITDSDDLEMYKKHF